MRTMCVSFVPSEVAWQPAGDHIGIFCTTLNILPNYAMAKYIIQINFDSLKKRNINVER